jgi:uncharacterized low-complexity protein
MSLRRQNMRSMALRARHRKGEEQFFQRRFTFGGTLGQGAVGLNAAPERVGVRALIAVENTSGRQALEKPLRPPRNRQLGLGSAGKPWAEQRWSVRAWILVERPARERPMACRFPLYRGAERCCLHAELSMSTSGGGPPARAAHARGRPFAVPAAVAFQNLEGETTACVAPKTCRGLSGRPETADSTGPVVDRRCGQGRVGDHGVTAAKGQCAKEPLRPNRNLAWSPIRPPRQPPRSSNGSRTV